MSITTQTPRTDKEEDLIWKRYKSGDPNRLLHALNFSRTLEIEIATAKASEIKAIHAATTLQYQVDSHENELSAARADERARCAKQLPPLTDKMYHAVRGAEFEFSGGGPSSVMGYLNDDCLDEIWENINTALRVSANDSAQAADVPSGTVFPPVSNLAMNSGHPDADKAADAFWKYWRENGETHKHGYYESTWGAINRALRVAGIHYLPGERMLASKLGEGE